MNGSGIGSGTALNGFSGGGVKVKLDRFITSKIMFMLRAFCVLEKTS